MDSLSVFVLVGLLLAAGVVALVTLGPLGLFVGGALVLMALAVSGHRLFKTVMRRTSSEEGVHRRS